MISSANKSTRALNGEALVLAKGKSRVITLKSVGLKTDPWGTLVEIILASECVSSRRTLTIRSVRKYLSH